MPDRTDRHDCKGVVDPLVVGPVCDLCGVPHELDFIPDFPTPPSTPAPGTMGESSSSYMHGTGGIGEYAPHDAPPRYTGPLFPESGSNRRRRESRRYKTNIKITVKVKVRFLAQKADNGDNDNGSGNHS